MEAALSDRQIQRRFAHAAAASAEIARFARMSAAFRASALGSDTADALDLARDVASRSAGALARARMLRAIDELDERLHQAGALAVDVAGAHQRTKRSPRTLAAPELGSVVSDREHVVWPFDGEYWSDEVGSYRVAARSRCSR